jgi:hypothetical protein
MSSRSMAHPLLGMMGRIEVRSRWCPTPLRLAKKMEAVPQYGNRLFLYLSTVFRLKPKRLPRAVASRTS